MKIHNKLLVGIDLFGLIRLKLYQLCYSKTYHLIHVGIDLFGLIRLKLSGIC